MGRIQKFRLNWSDAWLDIYRGYDSTIEITEDGKAVLLFLVNLKPFMINLGEREAEFISAIKKTGIHKLSGYHYDGNYLCDGDKWRVDITIDGNNTYFSGYGTFPYEFEKLLEYLHREWYLPICDEAKQYYHKQRTKQDRYGQKREI